MTRKLQAYVRTHLHVASQEILASTMAGLESLEKRTRLRIHASTMRYNDQLEQLQDQLHDLRKEICQLIKKEVAKQEFHMVQILEEVRELNKWIHEVFSKGPFAVGSPKNLFDEEVSESGNQIQNTSKVLKLDPVETRQIISSNKLEDCPEVACGLCTHVKNSALLRQSQNLVNKLKNTGKVLKHDPAETKQTGSSNKLEDCPEVACGQYAHVEKSALSPQLQKTGSCCQMSNFIGKQYCAGVVDQTAPVLAVDTEDWAVKTISSSNKVIAQAVDQDTVWALDAEAKAYALSCLQCPIDRMLYAKESLGPHGWEQAKCNAEDETSMKSNLPNHSNPAANAVITEDLESKRCTLKVFSFMDNHAGSQATFGKPEACDMKEFVMSKRRIRRECIMSSKSKQFCTGYLVSGKQTGKQSWFLPIKERRSLRQPTCHFTSRDIERLVTAVEKLGTGRWRDIKETYFSVEKHRSAANLKDKWRSLLQSAKLAPAKQRSVKLHPMLVKRILDIGEGEKLAHPKSYGGQ